MPNTRTITGKYRLRPGRYIRYISSGTFGTYFDTSASTSGLDNGVPRAGWNNAFSDTTGNTLGDVSDSTYVSITPPSGSLLNWNASTKGWNGQYGLTRVTGVTPEWNYTITSVTASYKVAASASGTSNSNTIYYVSLGAPNNNDTFISKWSSVDVQDTSISTYTFTSSPNYSVQRDNVPNHFALCLASARNNLSSLRWIRCYEVWFDVSYSYVETEETVQFFRDDGCTVAVGETDVPTGSYTTWRHTTWDLTATVLPGYIWDGWYLNGQKVSSNLTYTYELYDNDKLYCITKPRKLFVGNYQVDEVYIGTSPVDSIYDGTEKLWGLSELYGDATAVG